MYDEKTANAENRVNMSQSPVRRDFCVTGEFGELSLKAAAAIVHSRTRYRDYRQGLLVRPEDMTEAQAYQWKQQLLRCTREPEEMRAGHQVRRAVICDGVYGVAGAAAYFRDIATGSFEDEGRRPAYGFVGLVWKNDSPFCPSGFPAMEDFGLLVEKYVIPRWEEPKNGKDAEKTTLSGYQEQWTEQADEVLLRQALEQAVRGEKVFYCTGLPKQEEGPCMETISETADNGLQVSGSRLNRRFVTAGILCGVTIGILIWKILFT